MGIAAVESGGDIGRESFESSGVRRVKGRSEVSGIPYGAEACSLAYRGWGRRIKIDVMIVIVIIGA